MLTEFLPRVPLILLGVAAILCAWHLGMIASHLRRVADALPDVARGLDLVGYTMAVVREESDAEAEMDYPTAPDPLAGCQCAYCRPEVAD